MDGVVAVVGDVSKNPENDGREQHGQCAGQINSIKCARWEGEVATNKVNKKILGNEIKQNGDTAEDG